VFRLFQFLVVLFALGASLAAILAALGFASPLLDLLNHLQPLWFVSTLVALLIVSRALFSLRLRAFMMAFAATGFLASAVIVVPEFFAGFAARAPLPTEGRPVYRLLTFNLFGRNGDMDRVAAMIRAEDPDIIALQEYFAPQRRTLDPLLVETYPYTYICDGGLRANVAIYARVPFVVEASEACQSEASDHRTARIVARFMPEAGEAFAVMTTHLDWPVQVSPLRRAETLAEGVSGMTARQVQQLANLAAAVEPITLPLIVAGDFNSTSWSFALRRFASQNRLERNTGSLPTFPAQFFIDRWRDTPAIIPLDHVLSRDGIVVHGVHTGAAAGSDHLPVVMDFSVSR